MKKKIILLTITIIILACILTACGTKSISTAKKNHDSINASSVDTYVALDEGKYYLFKTKNSKKVFKTGYDSLSYIGAKVRLNMKNESSAFLLAYNSGDAGFSVINQEGDVLISSTFDMKITNAVLHQNISFEEDCKPVFEQKAILINFHNDKNQERSALFSLNGKAIYYDKNGIVDLKYIDSKDYSQTLDYAVATTLGTIENINDTESKIEIFNNKLESVYTKNFSKEIIFSSQSVSEKYYILNYKNKTYDQSGVLIKSENKVDVVTGNKSYTDYTSFESRVTKEGSNEESCLLASLNSETGITTYTLINYPDFSYTFNNSYSLSNGRIRLSDGNGKYNVLNYDFAPIISGVDIFQSNFYSKESEGTLTIYNQSGQVLLSTPSVNNISSSRFFEKGSAYEYFSINDGANVIYKFFKDGALAKEYGKDYILWDNAEEYKLFSKTVDGTKQFYCYNFITGTETQIPSLNESPDFAVDSSVSVLGKNAKFYTLKDSKEIVFYKGISAKITPYEGDNIPGYAAGTQYMNMSITDFIYKNKIFYILNLSYKILIKENDIYRETGETLYAYYLIKDTGKSAELELIYKGYNAIRYDANSSYNIFIASTIDYFADIYYDSAEWNYIMKYQNSSNLSDMTIVYDIIYDFDKNTISLNKIAEIKESNAVIATSNYIIINDFRNINERKNSVYTYDGKLVLASKYNISDIEGNLAEVNIGNKAGVYNLKKGKFIEDIIYDNVTLFCDDIYIIEQIKQNGSIYTIKNSKGKKVVENIIEINYIDSDIDYEKSTRCIYFAINTGKNQVKLITLRQEIVFKELFDMKQSRQ